jgi:hypothetical protein
MLLQLRGTPFDRIRSAARSASERVADLQPGEAREIAVHRQELAHAVLTQESGDVRVVNEIPRGLAG